MASRRPIETQRLAHVHMKGIQGYGKYEGMEKPKIINTLPNICPLDSKLSFKKKIYCRYWEHIVVRVCNQMIGL